MLDQRYVDVCCVHEVQWRGEASAKLLTKKGIDTFFPGKASIMT